MNAGTFEWGGADVPAGEAHHEYYPVHESFLGDPISVPVTVVNGNGDGPVVFLTAAVHGDELNGVKVAHEAVKRFAPADLDGALVVAHVVNVPAYGAQQRYLPLYDQDLNRFFPGKETGQPASRIANAVYRGILSHCDYGLDFHTSTRGRTTMFHTRASVKNNESVERLNDAFGANVTLAGTGEEDNSIRAACTARDIPTVTVEMGEAHRFQDVHVERALAGIESVMTDLEMYDGERVDPSWRRIVDADREKTWVRSNTGGLVDFDVDTADVVAAGERICTVTDHFASEEEDVVAPFQGIVAGLLQNPVAQPGHPVCHLIGVDDEIADHIGDEGASD